MKLLSKFIFILGMAVLLFGCSKDGDLTSLGSGGNPVYGEKVEMTFGFTAADMESPVKGLYPCGEGAGYAGGITSAAMDGIRTAEAVAARYRCPGI